jgi:hypothetical protein
MKTIEQQDRMIEFGDGFSSTNLFELIKETWQNRKHIQKQLGPIMKREKEKARMSSSFLEKYLTL